MQWSRVMRARAAMGLPAVLRSVSEGKVRLGVPDLYRICALTKDGEDTLGLRVNESVMRALATQYADHAANTAVGPISPFQLALLEETLRPFLNPSNSPNTEAGGSIIIAGSTSTSARTSSVALGEPTPQERLTAIWNGLAEARQSPPPPQQVSTPDDASAEPAGAGDAEEDGEYEVTSNIAQLIAPHVEALEKDLRRLSPAEVSRLIKALAVANHHNYSHTSLLSRRGCEVAAELPLKDVCTMYFNLHKINTHDSLHAMVNKIRAHVSELSAVDVFLVSQALERQAHTSSVSAGLVTALAPRAVAGLPAASSAAYHRAVLVAFSRYNMREHAAVAAVLRDVPAKASKAHEKDLLMILQAACELGAVTPDLAPTYAAVLARLEETVPTMDIRNIDVLMDVLSFLPFDTSAAMQAVMARLDAAAGKLTVPQLAFTLQMLSNYPPAKGHICVVSLSFAAGLRAESIEAQHLEGIIVSLAQLQHFTDDFFVVADVFQAQKGGIRKLESLLAILDQCRVHFKGRNPDPRMASLVQNGVLGLAPSLNEKELGECRSLLRSAGLFDEAMEKRLLSRARQLQRGSGQGQGWGSSRAGGGNHQSSKRRKHYDPMADLLT